MTNWPVGLSTGCFYQSSILDCLETIRASGFSLIEVCSAPPHLDYHDREMVTRVAQRLNELGMEAYSFHAPFADHIDITSSNEEKREVAIREILQAAEAAALLKVHYFVIHPGPEHPPEAAPNEKLQRMQNVASSLDRVARRCAETGIICVLENKLPHLLFGNTSDILWILDAINSAYVGACLDTGHAAISGDLYHLIRKLAGHLRMLHVHDNCGNGDEHRTPGDGKIDWDQVVRELVEIGFRGALMLELAGERDVEATMAKARRGRAYLREHARRIALHPLIEMR
ncbi:MAG: sugar phosphate isomerase/epimerase family protein [Chthoniobacterales bacterium]